MIKGGGEGGEILRLERRLAAPIVLVGGHVKVDPRAMAERVFDDGAAVVMASSQTFGDGAKHQSGEEQWQVEHADLEQIAGQPTAFVFVLYAENASETNRVRQIKQAQREGQRGIGQSGHAQQPGRKADGNHHYREEECLGDG